MPLGPSWSSQQCHALLASLQESSPLPTSQPLRGSIAHLLLGSCSLFQVSHSYSNHMMLIQLWHRSSLVIYHFGNVYIMYHSKCHRSATDNIFAQLKLCFLICVTLCQQFQPSLFCLQWPFTPGWPWTSWASASVTGASLGRTYWAGWPCSWPSLQVCHIAISENACHTESK